MAPQHLTQQTQIQESSGETKKQQSDRLWKNNKLGTQAKITLLHATDDTIVPYENTESAYQAILNGGLRCKEG